MDYKQKYKHALSLAKQVYDSTISEQQKENISIIFPELKESEDEKIRKEIIQSIQDNMCVIHKDKCIAWLEKRDTKLQEYINKERNKKDFYCEGKEMSWNEMPLDVRKHDYPYYFKDGLDCFPFNAEKQGEQKPVEQDTEIHDLWMYISEWNDKFGRLPKDEDELAVCIDYVIKRQKHNEWSKEDEDIINHLIKICSGAKNYNQFAGCSQNDITKYQNWLKSLKDRVQPHPEQEWSKKDEKFLVDAINFLYRAKNEYAQTARLEECIAWLKSIKPNHWKPSKEQLTALKNAIIGKRGPLYDLYFDLENL